MRRGDLWLAVFGLFMLMAAGPTLVAVAHALVPALVIGALCIIAARLIWYFTGRY